MLQFNLLFTLNPQNIHLSLYKQIKIWLIIFEYTDVINNILLREIFLPYYNFIMMSISLKTWDFVFKNKILKQSGYNYNHEI